MEEFLELGIREWESAPRYVHTDDLVIVLVEKVGREDVQTLLAEQVEFWALSQLSLQRG